MYYEDVRPLPAELRAIYKADPNAHDTAYETILLHILHKGGLLEGGMPKTQFDIIFDTFIEDMNATAVIIGEQQGIANR